MSTFSNAVGRRYTDAYVVAGVVDGFGNLIKAVGITIGALFVLGALIIGSQGGIGVIVAVAAVGIGAGIATIVWILGILVSANGQVLKASLDVAVNSSRFLNDDEVASVMGLALAGTSSSTSAWRCRCGQMNSPEEMACVLCGAARTAA
jgi:hypothetical protein